MANEKIRKDIMHKRLGIYLAFALGAATLFVQNGPAAAQVSLKSGMFNESAPVQGPNGFGSTRDFETGFDVPITYTHGFYCDTTVPAKSNSGCEVGTTFNKPPAPNFDPLYITVPIGFNIPPMQMQCPAGLICIDHPATIDLSAIGGPTNSMTPGHDHYTTTRNGGIPEWWDVFVIGVTDQDTYLDIRHHGSFSYIQQLIRMGNKHVTKPIPTNLFLFFAVGR